MIDSKMDIPLPMPNLPDWRMDWTAWEAELTALFADMRRTRDVSAAVSANVLATAQATCEKLVGLSEFRSLNDRQRQIVLLSCFLHDVGKTLTTKRIKRQWISPNHDLRGAELARYLLWTDYKLAGTMDMLSFREAVSLLVQHHETPQAFQNVLKQGDAEISFVVKSLAANGILAHDFTLGLLGILGLAVANTLETEDACKRFMDAAERDGCLHQPPPFADETSRFAFLSRKSRSSDDVVADDTWGEIVMMAGLPGTGKDTWIGRNHPELPMISLDEIRKEIHVLPTEPQEPVVSLAYSRARDFLRSHTPFLWNATNITTDIRNRQLSMFMRYGASVHIVYLETSVDEQYRRNRNRVAVVPEEAVTRMRRHLVLPTIHEARLVEYIMV
ncbi:MAG: AAA family ATPase [Victivallales bacterium]|nr:AAA family ATPase [Victivallales bacterium]